MIDRGQNEKGGEWDAISRNSACVDCSVTHSYRTQHDTENWEQQNRVLLHRRIRGRKLEEGRGDHDCKTPDYSLAWTTMIPIGQDSHDTKSSHSLLFFHIPLPSSSSSSSFFVTLFLFSFPNANISFFLLF